MGRRIFIGIKASNKLQDEIKKWREKYIKILNVRWVPDKNLHVTLFPPWNEENPEELKCKLNFLRKMPHFFIKFNQVSYGPDKREKRLIWAKGEESKEMINLKKIIEEALLKKSINRTFKIHLTLARFKPRHFRLFKIKTLNENISWIEKVDSFSIFESKTLPSGAKYKILKEIKF